MSWTKLSDIFGHIEDNSTKMTERRQQGDTAPENTREGTVSKSEKSS